MEDFFYAGGLRAFLTQLGDLLDFSQQTVNGRTLGENIEGAKVFNDDVIRPRDNPLLASDGLAVLHGNLAPDGAVIKPAAMEPHLRQHTRPGGGVQGLQRHGRAHRRPGAGRRPRTASSCCKAPARRARPGMPEWGQLPIPKKLLQAGRARHAAHQRCAHERHQLRRLRAARRRPNRTSAGRWRWCATAT